MSASGSGQGGSVIPVVICGGSGARLWPLSREAMPKQFLPLLGDRSTFQAAMQRAAALAGAAKPVVVTHETYRFTVIRQLAEVGADADLVLEPSRHGTAAAVAAAMLACEQRDSGAIVVLLAADHRIEDEQEFAAALETAIAAARATGLIVAMGIRPAAPVPAYGYVRPGEAIGAHGLRRAAGFREKPAEDEAARLCAEGWFWNSGNLVFPIATMRAELTRYAPDILAAAERSFAEARRDNGTTWLDAGAYEPIRTEAIDRAVLEVSDRLAVLPVPFAWRDIGSWPTLLETADADTAGNRTVGEVATLDTRNSLVHSEGVLTAVAGLDNVVIVATSDAVLVADRGHPSLTSGLVEHLKLAGRTEATEHARVARPWGWYESLVVGQGYQVKRIGVHPGGVLSLQKHRFRAEHWVVVEGTAEVTVDADVRVLEVNQSVFIPLGAVHRLANHGDRPLVIIEVQVGSYTGEDDIIRLEDVYARA